MSYYIEKLISIKELDWVNEEQDTLQWIQAIDQPFNSIGEARTYIKQGIEDTMLNKETSYRITDGGRIFKL